MGKLKSLNSNLLSESSIEELEERLELSCWSNNYYCDPAVSYDVSCNYVVAYGCNE